MRIPITITVDPYMFDHSFLGNAVLPAVEAMRIVASAVSEHYPGINVHCIENARFLKFLQLIPGEESVEAIIDFSETGDIVTASLSTVSKLKSGITRTKEHVIAQFSKTERIEEVFEFHETQQSGNPYKIIKEKIYAELVPFAKAYQNAEWVDVTEQGAVALVKAPVINEFNGTLPLGSPFPLDAAFHAACVWGQRNVGIVGFPVAFAKRIIITQTLAGIDYMAKVVPAKESSSEFLKFDLALVGPKGEIAEVVYGLEMRDVSAGRLRPPSWIIALL